MAITVTSTCGKSFALKDEFIGKLVQCPACHEQIRVAPKGAGQMARPVRDIDPVFQRRKFLLKQKHLAISEKYTVADETGAPILFVQRPAHFLRNVGAALFGLLIVMPLIIGIGLGAGRVLQGVIPDAVTIPLAIFGGLIAGFTCIIALSAKRHVYFYRDESRTEKLLSVEQDKKFMPFVATYTIKDARGDVLATLRKNNFNFILKRWYCRATDGTLITKIQVESLILALLRLVLGTFFGLLRTNFVMMRGESDDVIAEFNRKFTILDRYVLDLSADHSGHIDPRLALAIGVMLDTGERR